MTAADFVRILAIVLGGTMIVTTCCVAGAYAHLVHVTKRVGPRFLPHHVTCIAAAFICLAIFGMAEMTHRMGEGLTWRSPLLIIAFSLANVAQSIMFSVVRAQLHQGIPPMGGAE